MPVFRLLRIAFEAFRFGLAWIAERLSPRRSHLQSPKRLCCALARLGTTFIKFGQALSIRRDMLPDRYVAALQSLQEHIAPFPGEDAIREIEHGLGRPINELFADFDRTPLAAALPLNEWSLAEAFLRVTRLGRGQNVFMPYDLVVLMRALFLAENVVRTLDPEFQLLAALQTKGPEVLKAAMGGAELAGSIERLKHEGLSAINELPEVLFSWVRRLSRDGEVRWTPIVGQPEPSSKV